MIRKTLFTLLTIFSLCAFSQSHWETIPFSDSTNSFYIRDIDLVENLYISVGCDADFALYLNDKNINSSKTKVIDIEKSLLLNGTNNLKIISYESELLTQDIFGTLSLHALVSGFNVFNDIKTSGESISNLKAAVDLQSSNLPIVVINTNGQSIPDDPKITAEMGIIYNGVGITNNITDTYNNYDGLIAIELRGETSQEFPKKSFLLETRDEFGENNNVSLLNMPAENDWILYAPYSDKSMLRNTFTFWLGEQTYDYTPRTAYCELVLNGEYQGVYVLMEKIKRDNNRVDIGTLRPDEIAGDSLTGGYIIRVDKRDEGYQDQVDGWTEPSSSRYPNAKDIEYQFYYPDAKDIVDEQRTYIKNYISDVEDILVDPNFDDHENGYNKYINIGSFIDFLLISELTKEVDNYRYSVYFYKKKESNGNELFAGPLWDFNLGYANVDYWAAGLDTEGWMYEDVQPGWWSVMFWYKRLMEDPYFEDLVATRWFQLRDNHFSDNNLQATIDSLTSYIDLAQARNYTIWPILGTYVWPNYDWAGNNYTDEVDYFETWMFERLSWMDDNLMGSIITPSVFAEQIEDNYSGYIQINIKLTDDYFNNSVPKTKHFSLTKPDQGVEIAGVIYKSATEVTLLLKKMWNVFFIEDLQIIVEYKTINGFNDLYTNNLIIANTNNTYSANANVDIFNNRNQLILKCDIPDRLPEKIEVFNTFGQLVREYSINKTPVNKIDLQLPNNIYYVKAIIDNKPYSKGIIIK